ncbi:hypothetical protein ACC764_38480, partial [Rhizobium ruizarguesonis]
LEGRFDAFLSAVRHLILPTFVLAFANLGVITRQIRPSSKVSIRKKPVTRCGTAKAMASLPLPGRICNLA